MLEKKSFMRKVISMAFIAIVGTTMLFGTGEEVAAASKKPYRVVITSVKSIDHDSVKITWKKTKYANKYKIYRATSNSKYRLVRTTKYRSFTDNYLKTGKRYYYKVKAVNGNRSGRYSYKKSVVPTLNKVSLNKITVKGEDYAKLTYKKVAGASGYQIYRSTTGKTGTFYKKGSTKYLSYKNVGLEADKGYYYKVRAYKKVNGKYKYGAFSDVRYVRTGEHKHNWIFVHDISGNVTGEICSKCEKERLHVHRILLGDRYIVPATCTEEGYYEDVCECGKITKNVIEPLGHTLDDSTAVVVNEATCQENGLKKGLCSVCGSECTEPIEKSECVWEPVTEVVYDGYYKKAPQLVGKICGICLENGIEEVIPLDGVEGHKALHEGESVTFYPQMDSVETNEWVETSKEVLIGFECKNCGGENTCSHVWEHLGTEYYYSCNLCGEDITDCMDEHRDYHVENDGFALRYTSNYRYHYKCSKCGVERIKDTCKTVVGDSHYIVSE